MGVQQKEIHGPAVGICPATYILGPNGPGWVQLPLDCATACRWRSFSRTLLQYPEVISVSVGVYLMFRGNVVVVTAFVSVTKPDPEFEYAKEEQVVSGRVASHDRILLNQNLWCLHTISGVLDFLLRFRRPAVAAFTDIGSGLFGAGCL